MTIIVTGAAGFIGFHLSKKLLERGDTVIGIDNFNPYYDPKLKESRTLVLQKTAKITNSKFIMHRISISNKSELNDIFELNKPSKVVNLAAQAGVRYSIDNPLLI